MKYYAVVEVAVTDDSWVADYLPNVTDLPPGTVPLLMLVQPAFSSYLEAQAKTAS